MGRMIKLHAPPGTDEANFGTERYRVDNDGTVYVPEEAAADLIASGGFYADPEPVELPEGMVRLTGPEGASCSWGGQSFSAGEDGALVVPVGAVAALASHGFSLPTETARVPAAEPKDDSVEQLPSTTDPDAPPPHEGVHAEDVEALIGAGPTPGAVATA